MCSSNFLTLPGSLLSKSGPHHFQQDKLEPQQCNMVPWGLAQLWAGRWRVGSKPLSAHDLTGTPHPSPWEAHVQCLHGTITAHHFAWLPETRRVTDQGHWAGSELHCPSYTPVTHTVSLLPFLPLTRLMLPPAAAICSLITQNSQGLTLYKWPVIFQQLSNHPILSRSCLEKCRLMESESHI